MVYTRRSRGRASTRRYTRSTRRSSYRSRAATRRPRRTSRAVYSRPRSYSGRRRVGLSRFRSHR